MEQNPGYQLFSLINDPRNFVNIYSPEFIAMESYGHSFRPLWMESNNYMPFGPFQLAISYCVRCGQFHPRKFGCRARNALCWTCGRTGHFAHMCYDKLHVKRANRLNVVQEGKPKFASVTVATQTVMTESKKRKSQKKVLRDQQRYRDFHQKKKEIRELPFSNLGDKVFSIEVVLTNKLQQAEERIEQLKHELNEKATELFKYKRLCEQELREKNNEIVKYRRWCKEREDALATSDEKLKELNVKMTKLTDSLHKSHNSQKQTTPVARQSSATNSYERNGVNRQGYTSWSSEAQHTVDCTRGRWQSKKRRGGHGHRS